LIYQSTRGGAPESDFATVILDGLAPDGGLYVPKTLPTFDATEMAALRGADLSRITCAITAKFAAGCLDPRQVDTILSHAFAGFTHPAATPLVELAPQSWLLELFHGPTLAFKDVAMQVLAPLMAHFLTQQGRTAFILGATSGDTGGAAMAAFAGVAGVRSLFLYPDGGVSPFQEAQMLGLSGPTQRAIPVSGSFDDCQRIVKSLVARPDLRERLGLTAVNSVNWGRILAQSGYYARTALILGTPDRQVDFVVPTGNFGNIYAGWIARRMGFPIGRLTMAVNENDSLHGAFHHGALTPASTVKTNTPAIDIQLASNLERLVHDLAPDAVRTMVQALSERKPASVRSLAAENLAAFFDVQRVSQGQTLARIKTVFDQTHHIVDPHTALALEAASIRPHADRETVVLATAHPIKFAETVTRMIDEKHLLRGCPSSSTVNAQRPTAIAATEGEVAEAIENCARN